MCQCQKSSNCRLRFCWLGVSVCAYAKRTFSEMVLIDVDKDRAEGEAMDISHGASLPVQ